METVEKAGVCMDHASAVVITFTNESLTTSIIESMFTPEVRSKSLHKSEKHMHLKEQREQELYFNRIAEVIASYNHVVLFGPTSAKTEFLHFLQENYPFDHIRIEAMETDNMTENQQLAFMRDYFQTNRITMH